MEALARLSGLGGWRRREWLDFTRSGQKVCTTAAVIVSSRTLPASHREKWSSSDRQLPREGRRQRN